MSHFEKTILHLGLGRFHRGHQAVYYQKMSALGDSGWGVISCSMRSADACEQMRKVNLKYPVIELSEKNSKLTWIESIQEVYSAHDELSKVMEAFLLPQLEIISLTITEKGYCLDSNGVLDLNHPKIKHDLLHPQRPESAIGILVLGLKNRMDHSLSGLTILSCDNLRANGNKLENAVHSYLEALKNTQTLLWINEEVSFPNTMVDRIVPALTPEKVQSLETEHGLKDSELIATEEFCQWVIEDNFKFSRPPWEKVGVQFVSDVKPYEEMKLRLLNASHSYLAYAGLNRGYSFVHEAIADKELQNDILKLLITEVAPTLQIPKEVNLKEYLQKLIVRFQNNKLPHQLRQIAMDGTQKLPQRFFSTLLAPELKESQILKKGVKEWIEYCFKNVTVSPENLDDPWKEKMLTWNKTSKSAWTKDLFQQGPFELPLPLQKDLL